MSSRVAAHTAPDVNKDLARLTEISVADHFAAGADAVNLRLEELDREWDLDQAMASVSALMVALGGVLGLTVSRRFLGIPFVVAGALFQHAVEGWSPVLPVLRRLGFRTRQEIDEERYALKAVRGDFKDLPQPANPGSVRDLGIILHRWRIN
ncbi:MAG: hypothetical protein AB2A00_00520 [Myxococcota bacterium]